MRVPISSSGEQIAQLVTSLQDQIARYERYINSGQASTLTREDWERLDRESAEFRQAHEVTIPKWSDS